MGKSSSKQVKVQYRWRIVDTSEKEYMSLCYSQAWFNDESTAMESGMDFVNGMSEAVRPQMQVIIEKRTVPL